MNEKSSQSSVATIKSKVKAVFLGEQSTGKTSILMRFLYDKFEESPGPTVGIDFMGKNFNVKQNHLRFQLWDTAGQERFRSLIPTYLKDASVTFIVFDLTNAKSLENIGEWVDLCQNNRNEKNILVFLGNKEDLKDIREVDQSKIDEKLSKYNGKYFEVSAKTGHQIFEAFNYSAEEFVKVNVQSEDLSFSTNKMEEQFNKALSVGDKNVVVGAGKKESVGENIKIGKSNNNSSSSSSSKKKSGCC